LPDGVALRWVRVHDHRPGSTVDPELMLPIDDGIEQAWARDHGGDPQGPSEETASIPPEVIAGIVTETGSPTSHAASRDGRARELR
jgi:hypothetical protein